MRVMPFVRIALVLALAGVSLSAQQSLSVELQRVTQQATATGDFRAAIDGYKRIVAKAGSNRAVAAQALVRMAESYLKLGDAEARTVWERVLREYGEQGEAVMIARARLGSSDAVARAKSERLVSTEVPGQVMGNVSADGRFITYTDAANGVVLHDLASVTDRVLSRAMPRSEGVPGFNVMSRDGKQVAFERYVNSRREIQLRIADVQGSDTQETRQLLALSQDHYWALSPRDWSPDGRWLAVRVGAADGGTQIGLVSVRDGQLRVLESVEWGGPDKIFFSPDSRYLAYSLNVRDTRDQSHVFVMAIDGSRRSAVVAHSSKNLVMGWSPDGASLLFASDRGSGAFGLWTLPVSDGQSRGAPTLVETGVMGVAPMSLGLTASGALYVGKLTQDRYLQVASIDLKAGTLQTSPTGSVRTFVGGGGKPAWSADGKFLAYRSCRASCDSTGVISIRSMDTGQVRELPMRLQYLQGPPDMVWSPDGRSLIVRGRPFTGETGIFRIDVQTGEATPDDSGVGPEQRADVTMDGKHLLYASARTGGRIVERDLSSGQERVVFQERAPGNNIPPLAVQGSPDQRYIAFFENNATATVQTLFIMPFGGGEPRELLRATKPDAFGDLGEQRLIWTPDSRALLVRKGGKELWLVPVADGPPRKLDVDAGNWMTLAQSGGFKLRPDGRQIAFVTSEAGEDKWAVWALENFLPTPRAKR